MTLTEVRPRQQIVLNRPTTLNSAQVEFAKRNSTSIIRELLREEKPSDLQTLESLLEGKIVKEEQIIDELIFDWTKPVDGITEKPLNPEYRQVPKIQYEGLRDGDQIGAPGIHRLSTNIDAAKEIFLNLPNFSVDSADLGMPISGSEEQHKILEMIQFINDRQIPIIPAVAGRTHPDDVVAMKDIAAYSYKHFGLKVNAYLFVGSSRIRMLAQGQQKWNLNNIADWTATNIQALKSDNNIGQIIVPFEDTFGSFPEDLDKLFTTAFQAGADGICICDTCSRGFRPAMSRNIVRFIGRTIAPEFPDKSWEIHTHNMMGDAITNTIVPCNEGIISRVHGTFGGVGDLGGNMPIEKFLLHAVKAKYYPSEPNLKGLGKIVNLALCARGIRPDANPFYGSIYSEVSQYVPTGIHASAFQRMEEVGPNLKRIFELVYFPISPTSLDLPIHFDIVTPVSGKSNVLAKAKVLLNNPDLSQNQIDIILSAAKKKGEPLTDEEFISLI